MARRDKTAGNTATGNRKPAAVPGPTPWHPTHTRIVPNSKVTIDPISQHYPQGNTA